MRHAFTSAKFVRYVDFQLASVALDAFELMLLSIDHDNVAPLLRM